MHIGFWDVLVFLAFVVSVVSIGLWKSREEKKDSDGYFLAGRGLKWWLIGFSLIAANISTEQFVGMSGNAASHVGLAIASYEWMAAITLVVVAFAFLPYFLRAGIYTMPEFLEYRFNKESRTIMAAATIFIYLLLMGSVTYSGALTIQTVAARMGHPVSLASGSLVIGLIAMIYVAAGGLKACAWADLIQGSSLILGGVVILYFAFQKLGLATEAAKILDPVSGTVAIQHLSPGSGALERFWDLNRSRLNMFLPASDPTLPWTALLLGLWIPNFYYWGLNQYITQRTLGSASLAEGQKGIVFAAFMKLIVPFAIVIPGIIAFNLFANEMRLDSAGDNAKVIAKYVHANPKTSLVKVLRSPRPEEVSSWNGKGLLLAVFKDKKDVEKLKEMKTRNARVIPILEADFDASKPGKYTVFKSEDKAWPHVYPELALEIDAYNKAVEKAAKAAGASVTEEKPIAYKYDTAMGQLLANVLPQNVGIVGFVLAALLGAVVSSLAAMLNAASTIFSIDVYQRYLDPRAPQERIVFLGRICVVIFTGVSIFLSPLLGNPKISNSIFTIIQASQGFISPGILAVFVFGLLVRRGPGSAGVAGLLTNIVAYGALMLLWPSLNFLNRMAVCFGLCLLVMAAITIAMPLPEPVKFERKGTISLQSSRTALVAGLFVIAATLTLYVLFSPLVLAK